jgi:hypothetical protein
LTRDDVCRSKVRYPGKRVALRFSRLLGRKYGVTFGAYTCATCGGYHLTTTGDRLSAASLLIAAVLIPQRISPVDLAAMMRVGPWSTRWMLTERRGITARASVELSRVFGMSPEFWREFGAGRVGEGLARRRLAGVCERMKEAG